MSTPITMDYILQLIAVVVAVVGFLKGTEWLIQKITSQHDKAQKIDENSLSLEEYKKKTDSEIAELKRGMNEAHKYATDSLGELDKSIQSTLQEHKKEYMARIQGVENSILEMQAVYQQTVAVVDIKIENLEKSQTKHLEELKKAQDKHNNLMERMFVCEGKLDVHDEKIKVANHRLDDVESEIKIGH